jgi:hypothetical protein
MADQDIDRMVDMHAEVIGRQADAVRIGVEQALEQWRTGAPRLVMSEAMRRRRRTLKRKRQRQRAKARKAGQQ